MSDSITRSTLIQLVKSMYANNIESISKILETADFELLQVMVDIGRRLEVDARRTANGKGLYLFTPWVAIPLEGMNMNKWRRFLHCFGIHTWDKWYVSNSLFGIPHFQSKKCLLCNFIRERKI